MRVTLERGEIHAWHVSTENHLSSLNACRAILSADEIERAERFRFDTDRERFVIAHGILREILSAYTATPAVSLRFVTGAHGKPALDGGSEIRFNLSHAGNQVFYAVTLDREVGIDVERIRPDRDHAAIAQRFFSPEERHCIETLTGEAQAQLFFRLWTRKEAYLKAQGTGISEGLGSFSAAFTGGPPFELRGHTLWDLEAPPGYAAAVAVEGLTQTTVRYQPAGLLQKSPQS